ncbi:alpha/beta fold hydrolase [Altererythrobacter sp. BO-6]|uniref:S9 family peptidase n=1 Tax=Altererythrobacter sp. BO-6 TaxID=2604537 RepID=UPI0013E14528|nr:prolyl oligopeptidase family serine peptidase [Altererythrobacter sp. BO-6]QIG53443.1 alpha/beta fold hydrolase [Altererythrobacter sp. BO-6]
MRFFLSLTILALALPVFAQNIEPLTPRIYEALDELPFESEEDPRQIVAPGLFSHHPPLREAMSEDGRWFVSHTDDGALRLRSAGNEPAILARAAQPFRWHSEGARLSSSGRWIAAKMLDDSHVYATEISARSGGVRTVRYSYAGQPIPRKRLVILPRSGGAHREVPLSLDYLYIAGFDADENGLRYVEASRTGRQLAIRHFDLETGEVETLVEERSEDWAIVGYEIGDFYSSRFEESRRLILVDDERFLWVSDRSGKRGLYLYTGDRLTILPIPDEQILLGVVGLEREADIVLIKTVESSEPWAKQSIYSLNFTSLESRLLIQSENIPVSEFNSGGLTVVTTDLPATMNFHNLTIDGVKLKPDQSINFDFLAEEPVLIEKLSLPGADGTPLQALLISPREGERLPLIDYIYGGPQTRMAEADPLMPTYAEAIVFARYGIATLFLDARGTPGRDAKFAHAQDGRFGEHVIADHANAIRTLLAQSDRFDRERIGIMGHSWGGYFTLRGMIEASDIFKAGIMMAPSTNLSEMRVPVEAYQGCLPQSCPDAYAQGDLTDRLANLRGPLLVIHGQADDDVLPEVTDRLEVALKAVGANHEIVRLPNAHHIVQREQGHLDRVIGFWTAQFSLNQYDVIPPR